MGIKQLGYFVYITLLHLTHTFDLSFFRQSVHLDERGHGLIAGLECKTNFNGLLGVEVSMPVDS